MLAAVFNARLARHITGASAVALLHLIVIAFLMRATLVAVHVGEPAREGIVWFVFPKPVKTKPVRVIPSPPPQSPRQRAYSFSGIALPPAFAPARAPARMPAGGLHALLFDCAPENLATLSAEQRLQCASRIPTPSDSDLYADHTNRSHDATLWARGRSRKDQPLLLPCASPYSAGISLGTVICVAHGLINGFDLDNQPGYGDVPQQVGVPNGGDPPSEPRR
jgi:hypothetical protein